MLWLRHLGDRVNQPQASLVNPLYAHEVTETIRLLVRWQ